MPYYRSWYGWRYRSPAGESAGTCAGILAWLASAIGVFHVVLALLGLFGLLEVAVLAHAIVGVIWLIVGGVGTMLADRISVGNRAAWVLGFIVGIVVMFLTWSSLPALLRAHDLGDLLSVILDVVAFFAALAMEVMLVFAAIDDGGRR